MTERQEYIKFIKWLCPLGTIIDDWTSSEPYVINKRTVFRVHVWKYEDYNDLARPENEKYYNVEFTFSNPGKYTRIYSTINHFFEKKDILLKYRGIDKCPWLK